MIRSLFEAPRNIKRLLTIGYDLLAILAAFYLASCLRLGVAVPNVGKNELLMLAMTSGLSLLVFIRMGMYRAILRYLSAQAIITVAICVCVSGLILAVSSFFTFSITPRSVPIIYTLLLLVLIGVPRMLVRSVVMMLNQIDAEGKIPVIIYGAGHSGHQLLGALSASIYSVKAFVDDNPRLHNTTVGGVKVHSSGELLLLIQQYSPRKFLLALGSANNASKARVLKTLEPHAIEVQTIPAAADILSGKTRIENIKDVEIEDLLGRDPVKPNPKLLDACIRNKAVMVTGAGGSIGSELCRQIIKHSPKVLILFEQSEFGLYAIEKELQTELSKYPHQIELVALLGSVQSEQRLLMAMQAYDVQTVYHAAAYKHVPLVEHNIVEGVNNNVMGTWHCAEAAIKAGVESFVLISTDKAVRPTNIMGTTKRVAELVLQGLAQRQTKTRFTMVRFGNVLGSSGSVVPLFRQQIKLGGPVTVTHPDIIRYFMTIPEAAELVIQAGSMGKGGDVFVLDMGDPVKIIDLARRMIHLSGLEIRDKDHPHGDIEIQYTGLRPGEKLFEELLIGDNVSGTEHERIMRAEEHCLSWSETEQLINELKKSCDSYRCDLLKEILLRAPAQYSSSETLADSVWCKRHYLKLVL
ncbi:MAG: nucleoside-diphosphate sugar epimerase [Cellvibrio sp. 79]|nr:MAG: nucleoside-diphosphate sugar epimerase [Cellvibrio sp. 79]